MKRSILATALIIAVCVLSAQAYAQQVSFDMTSIKATMTLGPGNDAEVVAEDDESNPGYCQGIIRYRDLQLVGSNPTATPGDMWGYYAAKIPEEEDCSYLETHKLPAIIYLHPYGPRVLDGNGNLVGGLRGSLISARNLADATGGIAFALSSPGQGFNCSVESEAECTLYAQNQVSYGDGMSPAEIRDGFDGVTIEPARSMFYSYAHMAMRAVTMVEDLFEATIVGAKGYADGKIVMAGICGGSITTLIANGFEDRLDGVIAIEGMGGWEYGMIHENNWFAPTATAVWDANQEPISYDLTVDCNDPPSNEAEAVCTMADYLDPTNFAPNAPVMLIHGAQDEFFPLPTFKATRDALLDAGTADVFTYLVADLDHHWYLVPSWLLPCPESYMNWSEAGADGDGIGRIQKTFNAFFSFVVNGVNLAYYGDPDPTISLSVTGVLRRDYRTDVEISETTYLSSQVQIGFSGTQFLHVYPGLNGYGYADRGDIDPMTSEPSCATGKDCYSYTNSYAYWGQPEYYGSYVQVKYTTEGGLEWYLTTDIVGFSQWQPTWTPLTFEPLIRCNEYGLGCVCADPAFDDGEAFESAIFGDS